MTEPTETDVRLTKGIFALLDGMPMEYICDLGVMLSVYAIIRLGENAVERRELLKVIADNMLEKIEKGPPDPATATAV